MIRVLQRRKHLLKNELWFFMDLDRADLVAQLCQGLGFEFHPIHLSTHDTFRETWSSTEMVGESKNLSPADFVPEVIASPALWIECALFQWLDGLLYTLKHFLKLPWLTKKNTWPTLGELEKRPKVLPQGDFYMCFLHMCFSTMCVACAKYNWTANSCNF